MPKLNKNQEKSFAFVDLFAGIGGFRMPLEESGGTCVFSSEWDDNSRWVYRKNFEENPHGDITKIDESEIPAHDVLCAGFPCQAFSISGNQHGFEDARGTLFFDIARIAKYRKPEILFLENVKNFARHDNGKTISVVLKTLDEIGYRSFHKILKASDFGLPQSRERLFIIAFRKDLNINGFRFPEPLNETKAVKDILEPEADVSGKCYINRQDMEIYGDETAVKDPRKPLQIGQINKGGQGERIYSIYSSGITLSAYGGGVASKTGAYLVNGKVRKLTPREAARMQGFPETFSIYPKNNIAYKQFGNSVPIPLVSAVFKQILRTCPGLTTKRFINSINKRCEKIAEPNLI